MLSFILNFPCPEMECLDIGASHNDSQATWFGEQNKRLTEPKYRLKSIRTLNRKFLQVSNKLL